jgi:hypothetical protein
MHRGIINWAVFKVDAAIMGTEVKELAVIDHA